MEPGEKIDLPRADRFIKEGRFEQALSICEQIQAKSKKAPLLPLQFRIALCQEAMGKEDDALTGYQDLFRRGTTSVARLALLSQARIHLRRNQPDEAKYLLWPLFLHKDPEGRDNVEAAYYLGMALAWGKREGVLPDAKDLELAFPDEFPWHLERFLEWFKDTVLVKLDAGGDKVVLATDRPKTDPFLLEGSFSPQGAAEVIEGLAAAAGLQAVWTPEAKKAVQGRTVTLQVEKRPLAAVLEGIADSVDVVCKWEGDQVSFLCPSEASKDFLDEWRLRLARQIIGAALAGNPDHPLAGTAHLCLGNREAGRDPRAALEWYDRLGTRFTHSRETLLGHWNRGLLLQREGRFQEARPSFYLVADQSAGHPLADRAALHLGQMFVEEGELAKAIPLLKRAQTRLKDPALRARLLAILATAYTLDDDAPGVKAFLVRHREHFQKGPWAQYASLLNAYAPLRHANRHKNPDPNTGDLLLALLSLPEDNPLGDLGRHLAGLAYSDLGTWDRAAAIYQKMASEGKGPLGAEAAFRLADALSHLDRKGEARKLYDSVIGWKNHLSPWARFRLARLDLHEGQAAACAERCRRLLEEPTGIERNALFTLLGQAYEQLGRFEKAVKCYAGELPD